MDCIRWKKRELFLVNEKPNVLRPTTTDDLLDIIAGHRSVLPVGNRTKPGCSPCPDDAAGNFDRPALVSLTELSGIIEYEPSEFTFTAHAGTRVTEIVEILKAKNQYLPFDPLLVDAGATLGGTVASNAAGPGRFRYGGVRDFLLAVCLITGDGKTIRAGAKVVKNSAGFDIPKLIVGSLGRLGVMTEFTFKVFPVPSARTTIQVRCRSHDEAIEQMSVAASARWELDAIDYRVAEKTICYRVAGPKPSNDLIAGEILDRSSGNADVISLETSDRYWTSVRELSFTGPGAIVVKVPTTTTSFLELADAFADNSNVEMHLSVAGSLTWLAIQSVPALLDVEKTLGELSLAGLVFRGPVETMWLGQRRRYEIDRSIKQAMDPANKFPSLWPDD